MNTKDDRKKVLRAYKERNVTGGVYRITNTLNNNFWLKAAVNVQGDKQRFAFSQKTNSCVFLNLQKEWDEYGAKAFVFEILEEIEMKDSKTLKEFREDLKFLEEIWTEKLSYW